LLLKTIPVPIEWTLEQNDIVTLFPVKIESDEWKFVQQHFNKTLSSSSIQSIARIQNIKQWRDYNQEIEDIITIRKLHERPRELWLWHGTKQTHPDSIYKSVEDGLDLTYSKQGMWGRGLYFAENASYSDVGYSFREQDGTKLLLLMKVLVGNFVKLQPNGSLNRAPPIDPQDPSKGQYDSVEGETYGSTIYILYKMRRAYPYYLIKYK